MIDLSSLAAPMTKNVMTEGFGPTNLSALAGGATAGNGATAATGSTVGSDAPHPSTDGFMQVLDMFLGGSPLSSTLLASTSTAITQTSLTESGISGKSLDTGALLSVKAGADSQPKDLDAATCERIASLLQTLGFQVKPAEIQELSPLDREQLGTALEFVQRNLERGADPGQIAENASMLLPRPWMLDDADGTPVATTDTATATDSNLKLPADFAESLKDVRAKIQTSLGQQETPATTKNVQVDAANATTPLAQAQADSAGSEDGNPSMNGKQGTKSVPSAKKASEQNPSIEWNQQLQQAAIPAKADETTATQLPRHIAPGGTTSELIGRQVLEKVHVQLNEGHREVKLRLWPEELGEIRLALKMTDGDKVHANMVVENDAVRQAMLDAAPQLKDALARHGLDLERLSVSVSHKDTQESGADTQSGKDQRNGSRKGTGNGGWNETTASVSHDIVLGEDTGVRNGLNTIDLWS